MTGRLLLAAAVLMLGCATAALAEPRAGTAPKAAPAQPKAAAAQLPLQVYLAKGKPDACGPGCSEWIAVEGRFDVDAAGRVNAFFKRHGGRKLPIYFHSPGGSGTAAYAIGRQLRKLGLTTGVGRTIPNGCASSSDRSNACNAAKRSPQAVGAEWRPDANCSSACVYALIGGKVRHVPPSARVGVHSGRLMVMRKHADGHVQLLPAKQVAAEYKGKVAEMDVNARRYIREMGIDDALLDVALKVPHEDIYYLSRNQIAAFGIDRRSYVETGWLTTQSANGTLRISKWIVEARGADRKDYRTSIVALSCSQSRRATIAYLRGLANDEIGRRLSVTFSFGNERVGFILTGSGTKLDAVDTGSLVSSVSGSMRLDSIETAAAQGAIAVVEADRGDDPKQPRSFELSTHGLHEGLEALQGKCGAPPPDWANGASVPYIPADAKLQTPSKPGGGYPTELK